MAGLHACSAVSSQLGAVEGLLAAFFGVLAFFGLGFVAEAPAAVERGVLAGADAAEDEIAARSLLSRSSRSSVAFSSSVSGASVCCTTGDTGLIAASTLSRHCISVRVEDWLKLNRFHRMPIDMESPCGHRPGGSGAACTGAGITYMFCRLKSLRLDVPPAEEPPVADKEPLTAACAAAAASAAACALELLCVAIEIDGSVGFEGGVHVGQLVPPFLQVVAKVLALARARRATAMRRVVFTVGPRWG